jgi:hypothetical protein
MEFLSDVAGGVADGRGLAAAPGVGAVSVSMGTGVGACVDGPPDARGKMRIPTGRSIAIMCPAFSTRRHDRWPRWYPRSKPKHFGGFESRCTKRVLWIVGSTDCHLI